MNDTSFDDSLIEQKNKYRTFAALMSTILFFVTLFFTVILNADQPMPVGKCFVAAIEHTSKMDVRVS